MTTRACKGCMWWQELGETPGGTLMGECRAYPARPKVMSEEEQIRTAARDDSEATGQAFFAVWPLTEADEWCAGFTTESHGVHDLSFIMGAARGKMN